MRMSTATRFWRAATPTSPLMYPGLAAGRDRATTERLLALAREAARRAACPLAIAECAPGPCAWGGRCDIRWSPRQYAQDGTRWFHGTTTEGGLRCRRHAGWRLRALRQGRPGHHLQRPGNGEMASRGGIPAERITLIPTRWTSSGSSRSIASSGWRPGARIGGAVRCWRSFLPDRSCAYEGLDLLVRAAGDHAARRPISRALCWAAARRNGPSAPWFNNWAWVRRWC